MVNVSIQISQVSRTTIHITIQKKASHTDLILVISRMKNLMKQ